MNRNRIRLSESQLHNIIKESVKSVLNEYEQDIDDDTYFGGGLPDDSHHQHKHNIAKDVNDIIKQIRPYLDKLWDLGNNANGDSEQFFSILNEFESLPQVASRNLYY